MADVRKTVDILFSAQNQTGAAINDLNKGLAGIGTNASGAAASAERASDELEKMSGKKRGIGDLSSALQGLAASLIVKDFIDANVALETFRNTMVQVTGSSDGAAQEIEYLREASNRLGLEFRSASESYSLFAAAARGTQAEGKNARLIFEAFAGTLSALGRSSNDVNGALVQLSQGVGRGRFELEDLKSIAERVPGFFDKFSEALNVTTAELFDFISKGKIGTPEILKLAEVLNKDLAGANFETFNAELNRLKNQISETFTILGDAGAFEVLKGGIELATISAAGFSTLLIAIVDILKILGDAASNTGASFGDLFKAFLTGGTAGAIQEALKGTPDVLGQIDGALLRAADRVDGLVPKFLGLENQTKNTSAAVSTLAQPLDAIDQGLGAVSNASANAEDKLKKTAKATKDSEKSFSDYAKIALETKKAANDFAVELEQIASNERIKIIDARVQLDIADAQANAQIIQSTFEAISATFASTGDVIGSVFGALGGIESGASRFSIASEKLELIRDQLEIENKNRERALDLQEGLTQATIENIRAKTTALQGGNPLIQIDGAGLQPHLEAFMFEILKSIQTRVNADGLEMLVGV